MVELWIVWIVGVAALIVGWVVGFLDSNLRTAKKIKSAELQAQIQVEEARRIAEGAAKSPGRKDLLRLWTDAEQRGHLELDGAPVASPQEATPEQRRRLEDLIRVWAGGGPVAAAQPSPARPPQAVPPAVKPEAKGKGKQEGAEKIPGPKSIVVQIDEILQKKLAGTPLEAKGIHLIESADSGVLVYIGLDRYEGIDAVPDPQAVALIRSAISEWESKPH